LAELLAENMPRLTYIGYVANERFIHLVCCCKASPGFDLQRAPEDIAESWGESREREVGIWEVSVKYSLGDVFISVIAHDKGVNTHEEFIGKDAACKNITASIDGFTKELLGGEVAELSERSFFCPASFEPLKTCDAKVSENHGPVTGCEDIVGIHISVHQTKVWAIDTA